MLTPEDLAAAGLDQMLTLVTKAKTQRDPIQWLEDTLLDMRLELVR